MAATWTAPTDFANEHTVTHTEWNAVLGATGSLMTVTRVADRDVTTLSVGGTTTETSIYSVTIAGGALSTDRMMRVRLIGQLASPAGVGSQTVVIRGKFGGSTFAAGTLTFAENTTNDVVCEFLISAHNATNAQRTFTTMTSSNTGGSSALVATNNHLVGGLGLAVDSTANQTLQLTAQNSSSNASFVFSGFIVFTELLQ